MMPFTLPSNYPRIRRVNSFHELVNTRFANGVNALCWERNVNGDFAEVVHLLGPGDAITTIDDARLLALPVSAAGRTAVFNLLADQRLLREHNLDPALNCIHGYAFGQRNLWRISVARPGCTVPPCIHRAPGTSPGQSARLLLIS